MGRIFFWVFFSASNYVFTRSLHPAAYAEFNGCNK